MPDNLKAKATKGIMWTALEKYSSVFISFVSSIILARLLTPYDYGCIGMLSIFMVLAQTIIDGGFGSALIQKKEPTQEDYSTIFWWNISMSFLLYFVLFFCAPAIARFYKIPLLSNVLRVQGLVLFLNSLNVIQRIRLFKDLDFKLLSKITIIASVISLGVTVFMAYNGFGVWSLVAQNLLVAAIPSIAYWIFIKWRPVWIFSKKSFKELFSFGFFMFMSSLINTFCSKLNNLLIGKLYSPVTLGYFSKAMSTENLASTSLSSVMSQVTYPLYAQVQDNKAALANMVKRFTMTIAFLTFPMMAILMLTAKPIFVLLYSDRWLPCVPYFQVLCLVGLSECLQAVNSQTIAAIGKSRLMFRWTLVKRTVGLAFMIGGLYWYGMKGLLVGCVIYNWFCYAVNIGLVSKFIGYKWNTQLFDLLPIAIVTVIAAVISLLFGGLCKLGLYFDGLLKFSIFIIVFIGWALLFKPESYRYFLTVIPERFKFWQRNKNKE
jgi:O-antigen/teichoic acid export membrane protein